MGSSDSDNNDSSSRAAMRTPEEQQKAPSDRNREKLASDAQLTSKQQEALKYLAGLLIEGSNTKLGGAFTSGYADADEFKSVISFPLPEVAQLADLRKNKTWKQTSSNEKGRTLLHWAARAGLNDFVKVLLEYRANTEALDKNGQYPLHEAIKYGHTDVAITLISKGARLLFPDASDSDDGKDTGAGATATDSNAGKYGIYSPLALICMYGNKQILDFIKKNTKYQKKLNSAIKKHKGSEFSLPRLAMSSGHVYMAFELLARESKGDSAIESTESSLSTDDKDMQIGRLKELAKLLVSKGSVKLDAAFSDFKKSGECKEVINIPLPDVDTIDDLTKDDIWKPDSFTNERKATLLHWAAGAGLNDCVEVLLKNGANVAASNKRGQYPLHEAIINNHSDVAITLLKDGAPLVFPDGARDALGKRGSKVIRRHSPLDLLCMYDKQALSDKIKSSLCGHIEDKLGAQPDVSNEYSRNDLHVAVIDNNFDKFSASLKESGGSNLLWNLDIEGNTPVHLAVFYGRLKFIEEMDRRCPEILNKIIMNLNCTQNSIVHLAVQRCHIKIVNILLDNANRYKADTDYKDEMYCVNIFRDDIDQTILHRLFTTDITPEKGNELFPNQKMAYFLLGDPTKPHSIYKEFAGELPPTQGMRIEQDVFSRTALHIASANGCKMIAEFILNRSAEDGALKQVIECKDYKGKNAMGLVCDNIAVFGVGALSKRIKAVLKNAPDVAQAGKSDRTVPRLLERMEEILVQCKKDSVLVETPGEKKILPRARERFYHEYYTFDRVYYRILKNYEMIKQMNVSLEWKDPPGKFKQVLSFPTQTEEVLKFALFLVSNLAIIGLSIAQLVCGPDEPTASSSNPPSMPPSIMNGTNSSIVNGTVAPINGTAAPVPPPSVDPTNGHIVLSRFIVGGFLIAVAAAGAFFVLRRSANASRVNAEKLFDKVQKFPDVKKSLILSDDDVWYIKRVRRQGDVTITNDYLFGTAVVLSAGALVLLGLSLLFPGSKGAQERNYFFGSSALIGSAVAILTQIVTLLFNDAKFRDTYIESFLQRFENDHWFKLVKAQDKQHGHVISGKLGSGLDRMLGALVGALDNMRSSCCGKAGPAAYGRRRDRRSTASHGDGQGLSDDSGAVASQSHRLSLTNGNSWNFADDDGEDTAKMRRVARASSSSISLP